MFSFLGCYHQSFSFFIQILRGDKDILDVAIFIASIIDPPANMMSASLVSATKIFIGPLIPQLLRHPVEAEVLLEGGKNHVPLAGVHTSITEKVPPLDHVQQQPRT